MTHGDGDTGSWTCIPGAIMVRYSLSMEMQMSWYRFMILKSCPDYMITVRLLRFRETLIVMTIIWIRYAQQRRNFWKKSEVNKVLY